MNRSMSWKDAVSNLSSRISSDSRDEQRICQPNRGRIRGTSAAKLKPQATESTIYDFAAVVGRATNSLRYGMHPLQWEGLEHGCPPPAGPSVPLPLHRVISCPWTLQPGQLGLRNRGQSEIKGVVLHDCAECGGPCTCSKLVHAPGVVRISVREVRLHRSRCSAKLKQSLPPMTI